MAPPIRSGRPKPASDCKHPEMIEPVAQAKVLGTDVTLAAPGRSSGLTTAMTYDARVGTSICDNALRAISKPTAIVRFGANGISIRNTLDGKWVKTIVLIRPNRSAIGTAIRYET